MKVTLLYPPSANRYLRHTARGTYRTAEANHYREYAKWAALAAGVKILSGDVSLVVVLHPKLTEKGMASKTVIDLDNCLKVAIDALQGVAFSNDRQVKQIALSYGRPVLGGGLSVIVDSLKLDQP
jgi:crossover junction endodeoxyribonuclease RusA